MQCRNSIKREGLYQLSCKKAVNVKIKKSLCFYNPLEVYKGLKYNKEIRTWLKFISNHYIPKQSKVLLFYPCATVKPHNLSRSYRILFNTLSKLGPYRNEIHIVTISEPFGLIPEEFYGKKTKWFNWEKYWYDCPGLFEWFCNKYKQPFSVEYLDKSIEILAQVVAEFLKKVEKNECYEKIIAFIRPYSSNLKKKRDHTHRRIIERASKLSGVNVEILPSKEIISKIVELHGRFAWDMYGVAHPAAQEFLLNYLREIFNEN